MTRILWHSAAPWCGTGYGQQTALFAPRIAAAGHDLTISAYFGLRGTKFTVGGIDIYPGDDSYGDVMLPHYVDMLQPDVTITLLDPWVLGSKKLETVPLAAWTPVDHQPLGDKLVRWFEKSPLRQTIAMSRFGERVLRDAGHDPLYVPHGVDTNVFQPYDRAAARTVLDLPQEAFIVGFVGTNTERDPSRKAIPEILRAFAAFRERHDDALLYLHTEFGERGGGVNVGWFWDRLGLDERHIRGTGQLFYELGLQPEMMAQLFSAFDVLVSPSYGEGFGIAPLEAQACGTPVIVSDFSAQRELCGAGWLVEGDPYWINAYRAWWQQPRVESIVAALEQAYLDAGALRGNARRFAVGYDADLVFAEHWLPALARLGASTVEQAVPNRAARRAMARAAG